MTDALKKAREAIDQIDAQCIYCDGRGITRDLRVPCRGGLHKVSEDVEAALDEAVEEAKRAGYKKGCDDVQSMDEQTIEQQIEERVHEALAAERERVLREAADRASSVLQVWLDGTAPDEYYNKMGGEIEIVREAILHPQPCKGHRKKEQPRPEQEQDRCPRCGKSGPEARQVHTCMKARP